MLGSLQGAQVKSAAFLPVIASRHPRWALHLCMQYGLLLCRRAARIKSFRLRRVTFVTAKVTKTILRRRLPLRGSLRVSPDRRRAELGPSMALGQSALARLSCCDARQPSRRGKSKSVCFYRWFALHFVPNNESVQSGFCFADCCLRARAKSKSFRLRRVTFVTAKVTKTMCAERLPLRGSLRVSPDIRRAELGPSLALGQSALARLSGCDARQPSRRG